MTGLSGKGLRATFVVPWYGKGIPGGAEAEARRTAQNLAQAGVEVGVLTTCLAGLGSDWDVNSLPPGESAEDGVRVRRFPAAPRDGAMFARMNTRVMVGEPLTDMQEIDFFGNMVSCPRLFEYLAAHPEEGPFFFIPYLFTTSVWGPLVHPEKSVIIPCLHDEGYARLPGVRRAFESARAVVFHVPAERDLAARLYDLDKTEPLVLGEGIDTGWSGDGARFRDKFGFHGPLLLYAGRKDAGKNVPLLIQYTLRYIKERGGADGMKLILIGNLPAPIPPGGEEYAVDLGFVDLQDKYDAYAAADLLIQPSLMESFSIVIMESWLAGTPVMVHSGCAVTREHAETSGGGLHFADYPHFAEALDLLMDDPELRGRMGRAGREYVLERYTWPVVTDKFIQLIQRLCNEPYPRPRTWDGPPRAAGAVSVQEGPVVHQMVPDFSFGDAIGSDALAIQKALRAAGARSDIFAKNMHQKVMALARPWEEYAAEAGPGDVLIMHFSIGHEVADALPGMPGRKVLRYHNITPAEFLETCAPTSAERCRWGRRQLAELAPLVELGMGVSAYNCGELSQAGCAKVAEVPILLDLDQLSVKPDPLILDRFGGRRKNVLHVGRIVPNKAIEDLIKTQYWLSRLLPGTRLLLVGTDAGWRPYAQELRRLVRELRVPDVHFSGHVSFAALMGYYSVADLYLCQSLHEGFCVPLVEAMQFGLPIVARATTGVPGTLADGGVLMPDGDPLKMAEMAGRILGSDELSGALSRAASRRLERFRPRRVAAELIDVLNRELGLGLEQAS